MANTVNQLRRLSKPQLQVQSYQLLAKAVGAAFVGKSKEMLVDIILFRRELATGVGLVLENNKVLGAHVTEPATEDETLNVSQEEVEIPARKAARPKKEVTPLGTLEELKAALEARYGSNSGEMYQDLIEGGFKGFKLRKALNSMINRKQN